MPYTIYELNQIKRQLRRSILEPKTSTLQERHGGMAVSQWKPTHKNVYERRHLSSRTLWFDFRFSKISLFGFMTYGYSDQSWASWTQPVCNCWAKTFFEAISDVRL